MKFKKVIVSALSISALALSITGTASAKEQLPSQNVNPLTQQLFNVNSHGPIKLFDKTDEIMVGDVYNLQDPCKYSIVLKGSSYVEKLSETRYKAKKAGTTEIMMYKSNMAQLGKITLKIVN
nr:hypothetical protein [Bacillus subtilis]